MKQLEAKARSSTWPTARFPQIGLKIAYITDPQGVYIELTQGYTSTIALDTEPRGGHHRGSSHARDC